MRRRKEGRRWENGWTRRRRKRSRARRRRSNEEMEARQ